LPAVRQKLHLSPCSDFRSRLYARTFASASSAPAYGYDPYGNALQATAPLTDFGYAGMSTNADSGLYLTQYRAYDPVGGRWLTRDPIDNLSVQLGTNFAVDDEGNAVRDSSIDAARTMLPEGNNTPRVVNDIENVAESNFLVGRVTWPNEANLYIYANGNPLTFTDPNGEGSISNWIRACGIVIGMATGSGGDPGTAIGNRPPPAIIEPIRPGSTQGPKPK
jgi:RHS repeat-associated protein